MSNGVIIYGSTSYELARNFKWGYSPQKIVERIVNRSTSGRVTIKKRHEYREYGLEFEQITDSQLETMQTIEAYDGTVTFCPFGAGGVSVTGFFSLGAPSRKYTNNNAVSAVFSESVE